MLRVDIPTINDMKENPVFKKVVNAKITDFALALSAEVNDGDSFYLTKTKTATKDGDEVETIRTNGVYYSMKYSCGMWFNYCAARPIILFDDILLAVDENTPIAYAFTSPQFMVLL